MPVLIVVVLAVLLGAFPRAARAEVPAELFDRLKSLHDDLYGFTPEEQATWEAGRYSRAAFRVGEGSVTLKEVDAWMGGQVNLHPADWMTFRFELRDDRSREAEVARFSGDLLLRITPFAEAGPTGSPDVLKDQSAWGGALLLHSLDRRRYAILRVIQDRPLFNFKNLEGGQRDGAVVRAQFEARWAQGPGSLWLRADLGNESRISYPRAPPNGLQTDFQERNDLDLHLRWALFGRAAPDAAPADAPADAPAGAPADAPAGGEAAASGPTDDPATSRCLDCAVGLRLTARGLDSDRTEDEDRNQLRRGFVFARAYALVPLGTALGAALRGRAVLLYREERARGLASSIPFTFTRRDLGLRLGAVFDWERFAFEAGYGAVHSSQAIDGGADVPLFDPDPVGDKLYVSLRARLSTIVSMRFLVNHQIFTGRFGGFAGSLQVLW